MQLWKKKKAKPKTCTLVLAYVHKRVLEISIDGVKSVFFSSCTVLIVYDKIIKTMVRELVQMNIVFSFVIRYSTGLEYFNLIARKLLMKINK